MFQFCSVISWTLVGMKYQHFLAHPMMVHLFVIAVLVGLSWTLFTYPNATLSSHYLSTNKK